MSQEEEEKTTQPVPVTERWIYGGLRMLKHKKIHAWLPEPPAGQPLGRELWYRHHGSWLVGGIYQASVSRPDGAVNLHGAPGRWLQRLDDHVTVARMEILDRQTRDALALIALERKAAKDPALAKAMEPLLAVAATLTTEGQVRALMAYVAEQVYAARFRR
jgi:hypothetical protein